MKTFLFGSVVLCHLNGVSASNTKASAIAKVVDMLEGMKETGKHEMQAEKERFAAYKQWCADTKAVKSKEISAAKKDIVGLEADIESANTDAAELSNQIAERAASIAKMEREKKLSIKERSKEHAEFLAVKKDYEESIDATAAAIKILEAEPKTVAQQPAETTLLQISEKARQLVMQHGPDGYAYENSGGGIVELLGNLEEKFEAELNQATEEEMKKEHAHQMIVENLDNLMANEDRQKKAAESLKGQRVAAGAAAERDLVDTKATLASDEKYISDTMAECSLKAEEFAARQKLRAEELDTLDQAMEIMGKVPAEHEAKYLSLLQIKTASAPAAAADQSAKLSKFMSFLNQRGLETHSKNLQMLALRVEDGPFDKVIQMVRDLIRRLQEESNNEASKNAYCSTAMAENKLTREEKQSNVDDVTAEVEELKANIEKMTTKIAENQEAIEETAHIVKEASAARSEEKASNKKTMADAKEASYAVAQAISVLAEFYQTSAEAKVFVQQDPAAYEKPETWTSAYTGMQGHKDGVLGLLKVIQSDFVKLGTDTEADESQAAEAHDQFLYESDKDTSLKETEIKHLTSKKVSAAADLTAAEKDLEINQEALAAAQKTYTALFEECDVNAKSADQRYKERMARRSTEIQSLKEALEILSTNSLG